MFAGVFVVLGLLITPQLRDWWLQQRQLHELRTGITTAQREVDALRAERARWQDPEFVKAQARKRLHFVLPGETGFAVTGGQRESAPAGLAQAGSALAGSALAGSAVGSAPAGGTSAGGDRPWFDDLWASVRQAGDPPPDDPPLTDQQLIDRRPGGEVLIDRGPP